jgi:hypothetical protein|tara:strand:+ start:200 stop:367 length:168 start_codon:yes stop_codon:yes gene_type:complete
MTKTNPIEIRRLNIPRYTFYIPISPNNLTMIAFGIDFYSIMDIVEPFAMGEFSKI